jgi:hypothetical protein
MEDVLPAVGPGHVLFVLWETKMSEYTETDLMYDLEAMVREEAEHELRSLIIELSSPHYPPPVREAAQSGDADTALERLREWLAAGGDTASDPRDGQDVVAGLVAESVARHDQ